MKIKLKISTSMAVVAFVKKLKQDGTDRATPKLKASVDIIGYISITNNIGGWEAFDKQL